MKKRLISTLEITSRLIPLSLYHHILGRDVIDFFWHAVSDEPLPHVHHLYPVVSIADFESALLYLKENYTIISYRQLHDHIFKGTHLPPKAVHISFDDGYAECFSVVMPLLRKYRIPCTFFLTTDLIDNNILFYRNKQSLCVDRLTEQNFIFQPSIINRLPTITPKPPSTLSEFISWFKDLRLPDEPLIEDICQVLGVNWQAFVAEKKPYLTTKQIQHMHAEGFTIGAHTLTHRKLVNLPSSEIDFEISESCQIIAKITGQENVPFSFPHSAWGLNRDHLSEIRNRLPKIGLLFDTKGLRRDRTFIQNRIWAERPLPDLPDKKQGAPDIEQHLCLAYQEAWIDEIMTKVRRLRQ